MTLLWWCTLILKFTLVSWAPLTADENYYWVWSQNLALSYYDHPPFVAWIFKLGSLLPGFMLKWPAVIMGHSALWIWYRFLKNIGFSEPQCRTWFLISLMAPLVGLASMVLTPDLPLLFFQALVVYFFERALNQASMKAYILFGLSLGLGFTSKYFMVLLIPCLILYLITQKLLSRLRWKAVGVSIIFSLIGALPVIWWNYQNEWASFRFQLFHGLGKKSWKPIWPWEYVGSVLLLILPFYWDRFVIALRDYKQKLLIYLSAPLFIFFVFTSFRSKVEANWSQLAFLPTYSLLAFYDTSRWRSKSALAFWSLCLVSLLIYWNRPWFAGCPEKLCEPQRYASLIEVSQSYQPFMASNYQMASFLWFQKKQPVYKLYDMSRKDFFDTFAEAKPKENEFYLAKHVETDLPTWLMQAQYQTEVVKKIDEDLLLLRVFK